MVVLRAVAQRLAAGELGQKFVARHDAQFGASRRNWTRAVPVEIDRTADDPARDGEIGQERQYAAPIDDASVFWWGRASVEHLRVAGLVAGAVVQKLRRLGSRLLLGFDRARPVQTLGSRNRRHHRGEIGELLGLDRDQLIAGLCSLQRAGRRLAGVHQRIDLCVGALEILHHTGLHTHRILIRSKCVLPTGLRVGEKLLRRGRSRVVHGIGRRERGVDRVYVIGNPFAPDRAAMSSA